MKLFPTLRYATLVWLTGLFGIPLLIVLYGTLYLGGNLTDVLWADRWDLLGFLLDLAPFTIPGWLLFMRATYVIAQKPWSKWAKKGLLLGIAMLLIIGSVAVLGRGSDFFDRAFLLMLYWIPGFLGIFIYRLPEAAPRRNIDFD
jgi:hypothetical protein